MARFLPYDQTGFGRFDSRPLREAYGTRAKPVPISQLHKPKDWGTPQGLQAALALTKGIIENPLTDIVVKGVGELVRGAEPTPKSKYEALMQKAAQARTQAAAQRGSATPKDPGAPGSPAMQRAELLQRQLDAMEQGMRGAPRSGRRGPGHAPDPVTQQTAGPGVPGMLPPTTVSTPAQQLNEYDEKGQWIGGPGVDAPPGYEEAKAELAQIYTQLGAVPQPDQKLMAEADRLEERAVGFEKQAKEMQMLSGVGSMSDLMAMVSSPNSTREHLAAAIKAAERFTPARTLTQWRKGVNPGDANRKRLVQAFLAGKPKPMTPYESNRLRLEQRKLEQRGKIARMKDATKRQHSDLTAALIGSKIIKNYAAADQYVQNIASAQARIQHKDDDQAAKLLAYAGNLGAKKGRKASAAFQMTLKNTNDFLVRKGWSKIDRDTFLKRVVRHRNRISGDGAGKSAGWSLPDADAQIKKAYARIRKGSLSPGSYREMLGNVSATRKVVNSVLTRAIEAAKKARKVDPNAAILKAKGSKARKVLAQLNTLERKAQAFKGVAIKQRAAGAAYTAAKKFVGNLGGRIETQGGQYVVVGIESDGSGAGKAKTMVRAANDAQAAYAKALGNAGKR